MKKHFLSKLLTILLITSMILTMLPVSAMAYYGGNWNSLWESIWGGSNDETADEGSDEVDTYATSDNYRIVHLDCGRKYFSVDNIKKLIDTMHQYGYNQLQLAFGNGGCRFLLDEMSLSFNNGWSTMKSDIVKENIIAGNKAFNGDERYLTQSEMTDIIEYARNQKIEIVPMLNMPGHADAIVHNTSYASDGKLNVNDETARNYGTALLKKYVDYFKDQGCKYFHFGSDESGYAGTNMTVFLTACAEVITDADMTPRAFNDATNVATMPTSVQITYWHKETGSKTASALASDYQMINTHGRWYYVIKEAQNSESGTKYWQGTVNRTETSVELPVMKAEKMDHRWVELNEYFDGEPGYGSTISGSRGTMFCIWCDASQNVYLTDSDVISDNENYGALYQIKKLAEHYWPDDVTVPGSTVPTVSLQDGSPLPDSVAIGDELSLKASQSVVWTTTNSDVIDLSVPAQTRASKSIEGTEVTAVAKGAGRAEIQVSDAASGKTNSYLITVAQDATSQEVRLQIGEKRTFEVASSVKAGSYINGNEAYLATAEVAHVEGVTETTVSTTKATTLEDGASYIMRYAGSNYALTSNVGKTDWGTRTLAFETYTAAEDDNVWRLEASGTGYKLKSAAGYLMLDRNTAYADTAGEVFTITLDNNGWKVMDTDEYCIDALGGLTNYSAGGWIGSGTRFDLYKVTEATEKTNTLTITGTGENVDNAPLSVSVGNTTYNITVTAPKREDTLALNYNKTKTFDGTVEILENKDDCVSLDGSTITAETSNGQATVMVTEKNDGGYVTARTTYTVTVSDIEFTEDMNLKVELWVTNRHVPANGKTHEQIDNGDDGCNLYYVSAPSAYCDDGVTLESLVPKYALEETGKNSVLFWKATRHAPDTEQKHQKEGDAKDTSSLGTDFTRIRFNGKIWEYLHGNTWENVGTDQIVAYYMQVYNTSPEIETAFRDYGNIAGKDGSGSIWYGLTGYTGLATAVVDQDSKSMSPDGDAEIYKNTLICYGANNDRLPGVIKVFDTENFRITKITLTHGIHQKDGTNCTNGGEWKATDSVKWDKTTDDAGEEWYNETEIWNAETSGHVTGDPILLDEAFWQSLQNSGIDCADKYCEAMLLLFYVEPVEKEDNLHIYYLDESNNNSNMLIDNGYLSVSVKSGTTFYDMDNKTDSRPSTDGEFTLNANAAIKNSVDSWYNINSRQLSLVNNLKDSKYKSGLYQYNKAELSENGKVLKLYYTLDESKLTATYVLDFGLPVKIPMDDILAGITNVKWSTNPKYGELKYDATANVLTYTPTEVLTEFSALTFTADFAAGSSQVIRIGVLPASNVLYEENFLTAANDSGWKKAGNTPTTEQETQKVGGDGSYNVFGYDNAYVKNGEQNVTGQLGVWSVKGLEAGKGLSGELTTEFYGNGFDLIGDCGKDTGRVFMIVAGEEKSVLVDVDTRYNGETLHQVPLAHVMMPKDAKYTVSIRAAGLKATTASAANYSLRGAATYAADYAEDYDADLNSFLAANGLSIADVEYVKVESAPVAAAPAPARRATSFYALDTVDATTAVERQAGTHVEIDSFRVYRSANDANYPENEKNVTYTNVLEAFEGKFTAFVENSNGEWETREAYESNGGPQNEIYLRSSDGTAGDAVAFSVGAKQTVQISARAVESNGKTAKMVVNGGAPVEISSNTEMYYEVTAGNDGIITIKNTGEAMLALGNLKVKSTQTVAELSDEQIPAAIALLSLNAAPETPDTVFEPTISAKVTTTRFIRSKVVTLTVSASADVAKLTVNDKELRPTNGWLVSMGWSKSYNYILTETVKKSETKTYEIIGYSADGTPSTPTVVKSK